MNFLGQKLKEVIRAKLTDRQTGGRTDEQSDGTDVYNVFFDNRKDYEFKAFHYTILHSIATLRTSDSFLFNLPKF